MPKSDLLVRILDTPLIERAVPRLQPAVLHKLIQHCGLEDCADLVALATPEQLMRVFDLDLWRSREPGLDEELDADRFGVWLEVLMESGEAIAAQKLMGIDVELVVAALAQHLSVFDRAAVARTGCEIGNYLIEARRTDSWDAIVQLLLFLNTEHHEYFNHVMGGCRRLSNSGYEIDGLHDLLPDRDQDLFDLAIDREQRREKQGHITPADARAFLAMARNFAGDGVTPNPIAAAYFRAIDWTAPAVTAPPTDADEATANVIEVLVDAGVVAQPRALLEGVHERAPRLMRIHERLQSPHDLEQLAFLANVLMAGCSVQERPFSEREASEAAAAVCNLGLENGATADHDLVTVFQIGWRTLHRSVAMYAAERLINVLRELRISDPFIQSGLDELRYKLTRFTEEGTPWRAQEALDVVMTLDMSAWGTLVGLISEYPVLDDMFISEISQIASVRAFLDSLGETLRG